MFKHKHKSILIWIWLSILISITVTSCTGIENKPPSTSTTTEIITIQDIPEYSGEPYIEINDNQPSFTEDELTTESYEYYSDLDYLGRCGVTEASIGIEIMPTEERGQIGQVKPTGWHTVKYDNVDGKYLYNRCHLIGYQLTGENANEKNLITGTRYMNTEGMLPFEDEVADYVKDTNNHVMYRITPVFEENNLVASGVQMEAMSVEDGGSGVSFNIFAYNVQPGITIDYVTGESSLVSDIVKYESNNIEPSDLTYIINKNTHKFHKPDCSSIKDIKPKNKKEFTGSRDELIEQGYDPCNRCKP